MKIGVIGDIHFSEYSSILRGRGNKYSIRLENCIDSINWAENEVNDCDIVVYLGDFFDKSSLNASELTALSEIIWNEKTHYFIVGNHELGINDLTISSAHIFNHEYGEVIDSPSMISYDDCQICFLPYALENNRENSISDYFGSKTCKRIIFSHNDIAGISLGKFISKLGFSIDDIESNCDLFINGHLHNGAKITDKVINLGNLTGQNFSEDAFMYKHNIMILDTDNLTYELRENPYAINFYKLSNIHDIDRTKNAIITIKVNGDDVDFIKNKLKNNNNVVTYKIVMQHVVEEARSIAELSVDHLEEFKKFVLKEIGNSPLVLEELSIING